jgi:4-carboxymuconolactone decarboxylase
MEDRERHEAGMTVRRAVLGDAPVDRSLARRTAFNEEVQDLITCYAWGRSGPDPAWTARRAAA